MSPYTDIAIWAAAGIVSGAGLVAAGAFFIFAPKGAHHAPRRSRKTPVPATVPELPASAEAQTETWPAIPAVAHEDPVHDETAAITAVVPAVKDQPTLLIPVAPKLGTVDVSKATHEVVEEFLGPDLAGCLPDGGVLVRGLAGDEITAHPGDRVGRDHGGAYVLHGGASKPDRGNVAVHGWETSDLTEAIADLGKEAVA